MPNFINYKFLVEILVGTMMLWGHSWSPTLARGQKGEDKGFPQVKNSEGQKNGTTRDDVAINFGINGYSIVFDIAPPTEYL
jgi:hypothetical protein